MNGEVGRALLWAGQGGAPGSRPHIQSLCLGSWVMWTVSESVFLEADIPRLEMPAGLLRSFRGSMFGLEGSKECG